MVKKIAVAAAILLGIGGSYIYLFDTNEETEPTSTVVLSTETLQTEPSVTREQFDESMPVEGSVRATIDQQPDRETGSAVVRNLGANLNPETHKPNGVAELVAIGNPLDPNQVYPDLGASELQALGEKVFDVENSSAQGSAEQRLVGEVIPSRQVR